MPAICTAVRLPFVRQYFWETTGGWGHRKVPEKGAVWELRSNCSKDELQREGREHQTHWKVGGKTIEIKKSNQKKKTENPSCESQVRDEDRILTRTPNPRIPC